MTTGLHNIVDVQAETPERPKYLLFDEAVCWIAFKQYEYPPIGPRDAYEYMMGDAVFEEEGIECRGKYELAQDQLIAAIENRLVTLAGLLYENAGTEGKPDENQPSSRRMEMHAISHEAAASGDFYEEDGSWFVADRWYDKLVVPVKELEAVFGGLTRRTETSDTRTADNVVSEGDADRKVLPLRRRGRPPVWDWEALKVEIIALANSPDGLPAKQAELESWAANYFQQKHGSEPSVSSIRSKLSPIYDRLRQKSR